jgi:hypothetical protein
MTRRPCGLVPERGGVLAEGSALDVLRRLPDGSCQVVFLAPPWRTAGGVEVDAATVCLARSSANATEHPPTLQRELAGPVIEVRDGRYRLRAAEVAGAHRTGRTFARNRREAPHGA